MPAIGGGYGDGPTIKRRRDGSATVEVPNGPTIHYSPPTSSGRGHVTSYTPPTGTAAAASSAASRALSQAPTRAERHRRSQRSKTLNAAIKALGHESPQGITQMALHRAANEKPLSHVQDQALKDAYHQTVQRITPRLPPLAVTPKQAAQIVRHPQKVKDLKAPQAKTLTTAKRVPPKAAVPTGPLTPQQQLFGKVLAKKTGLSPHVTGAWLLAEESGPAAQAKAQSGDNNLLNIGPGQTGPQFATPRKAAKTTAKLVNTSDYYAGIRASTAKGDKAQLKAISSSPWDVAHYAVSGGLTGTYAETGQSGKVAQTPASKQQVTRFKAIENAAKRIDSAHLPYVLGGGHVSGRVPGPGRISGYDCSGVVSKVLQEAHALPGGAMVSGGFENYGKPGPGAVTIYANSEHVFMRIGNHYFGTSHSNPGGGAGFIPTSYEQGEATSGKYVVRHVPGLGQEVTSSLGIKPVAPGLSYSPGGTSATVTNSVVVDQPGSSSLPPKGIKVKQIRRRTQDKARRKVLNQAISSLGKAPPKLPTLTRSSDSQEVPSLGLS